MTHRQAVALMVLVTLLWSIAGVVTRQLDSALPFEVSFWRSAFSALALLLLLAWLRGPRELVRALREGGPALWLSALCWCVMFTAFMVALSLTTVANVLVTMALTPLLTAIVARLALGHRLAARTWAAIVAAGVGIAWMYGQDIGGAGSRHALGVAVALALPLAAAVNWTLLQALSHRERGSQGRSGPSRRRPDLLAAVLLGAVLAALLALPLSLPFAATPSDIGWLALLGVVQLAIPCVLVVIAARVLSGPEVSLLALLEVVFGVAWAWLGAGETPTAAALTGGSVVLLALLLHELVALRRSRPPSSRAEPRP
jgi:drug/metabolite transporter (DMT)-like permease